MFLWSSLTALQRAVWRVPAWWVAGCLLVSRFGAPTVAGEPQTADDAIARYVEAIGGRRALAACWSIRLSGRVTVTQGMEARFVEEHKRPNKFRRDVTLAGSGSIVQAFDGRTAWQLIPILGPARELPATLARRLAEEADIDGPLVDYKKKGHRVEWLGPVRVDGRPAYQLRLIRQGAAEGEVDDYYLDGQSFVLIKIESKRTIEGKPVERVVLMEDYRPVGGLLVAHSIREREKWPTNEEAYHRTIEKVEINVELPDQRFSMEAIGRPAAATEPTPAPVFQNEWAARGLYDRMRAALRTAGTLSFESRYQLTMGGMAASSARYRCWLKKPNFFRVEAFASDGARGGILIGDGDCLWVYWPNGRPMFNQEEPAEYARTKSHVYLTKPAREGQHSIGHEVELLGVGIIMTIIDLSTFHGYTDSLQPFIDAVAGRGTETIGGEPCDVIEVSLMEGQRTWKMWLSKRDRLPRKLRETVRTSVDMVAEEVWTNLAVNDDIQDELFKWRPPAGWKEWSMPDAETRLLKPGTPAPDFKLALADGKTVRLSDYRGKAVMLVFWRVG